MKVQGSSSARLFCLLLTLIFITGLDASLFNLKSIYHREADHQRRLISKANSKENMIVSKEDLPTDKPIVIKNKPMNVIAPKPTHVVVATPNRINAGHVAYHQAQQLPRRIIFGSSRPAPLPRILNNGRVIKPKQRGMHKIQGIQIFNSGRSGRIDMDRKSNNDWLNARTRVQEENKKHNGGNEKGEGGKQRGSLGRTGRTEERKVEIRRPNQLKGKFEIGHVGRMSPMTMIKAAEAGRVQGVRDLKGQIPKNHVELEQLKTFGGRTLKISHEQLMYLVTRSPMNGKFIGGMYDARMNDNRNSQPMNRISDRLHAEQKTKAQLNVRNPFQAAESLKLKTRVFEQHRLRAAQNIKTQLIENNQVPAAQNHKTLLKVNPALA